MKVKRQIFAALFTLTLTSLLTNALYAQKNAVKTNLPTLHYISAAYERSITAHKTLQVEFQKWNETKHVSSTLPILGVVSSTEKVVNIQGYRMEMLARHYRRGPFQGGFMEGGLYFGKHRVAITETNSVFNPYYIFLFDFEDIESSTTTKELHKDVAVGGGKFGLGYQKALGWFSIEVSGGINFNAFNSKNVRPVLDLKGVSPYGRLAVGIAF